VALYVLPASAYYISTCKSASIEAKLQDGHILEFHLHVMKYECKEHKPWKFVLIGITVVNRGQPSTDYCMVQKKAEHLEHSEFAKLDIQFECLEIRVRKNND